MRRAYQKALAAEGSTRVDLHGNPVGEVSPKHRAVAARHAARLKVERAARDVPPRPPMPNDATIPAGGWQTSLSLKYSGRPRILVGEWAHWIRGRTSSCSGFAARSVPVLSAYLSNPGRFVCSGQFYLSPDRRAIHNLATRY
jgi:hypothetical protein